MLNVAIEIVGECLMFGNRRLNGSIAAATLVLGLGLMPSAALAQTELGNTSLGDSSIEETSAGSASPKDEEVPASSVGDDANDEDGSEPIRSNDSEVSDADVSGSTKDDKNEPSFIESPKTESSNSAASNESSDSENNQSNTESLDSDNFKSNELEAPKPDESQEKMPSDGSYSIGSAKDENKVVDAAGGSTKDGTKAQFYSKNGTDAQVWRLSTDLDGYTTIYHADSGKVLDVANGKAFEGAKVQLWTANGTLAQKWILIANGAFFKIASALDRSFVLDLRWGSTSNETPLQLWKDNGTQAQLWSFAIATTRRQRADAAAKDNLAALEDGTYSFGSTLSSGKRIDAENGSTTNGTSAQLWAANGTDAQVWTVSHDSAGYVTIIHAASGKALDVESANASSGARLQLWSSNGTRAQKWIAVRRADGSIKLLSALDSSLAVDVKWGSTSNGAKLWLYNDNGTAAQGWTWTIATTMRMRLDDLAKANESALTDGEYGVRSDLLPVISWDARNGGVSNGTVVQSYTSNGSKAQLWRVSRDSKGYLTFTNVKSGKVLDVCNGAASSGAKIQLYSSNGTFAQKWIAVAYGNTFKIISALNDQLVLDLPGASLLNSVGLQLYTDNGTAAQRWSFSNNDSTQYAAGASIDANDVSSIDICFGDKLFALPAAAKVKDVELSFDRDVYFNGAQTAVTKGTKIRLSDILGTSLSGTTRLSVLSKKGKELGRLFFMQSENVSSIFVKSTDSTNYGRKWIESSPDHGNATDGKLAMIAADGEYIYDGKLSQIKGRGNGSWQEPKRPYQIKLDKKTDLLQSGVKDNKAKTWVLIADTTDDSSSRNTIAYTLAKLLGVKSAVDFCHVDLYYDGEYRGSYLLCEKVQVNKGRVDINDLDEANEELNSGIANATVIEGKNAYGLEMRYAKDISTPSDYTGGYLIEHEREADRYMAESAWFTVSTSSGYQHFVCKSPEVWSYQEANYMSCLLQDLFDAFANGGVVPTFRGSSRAGKTTADLLDLDSLASIYWLNEIMKNRDGYTFSSGYLYKDSDNSGDGKIAFGPAWDFDLSSGNTKNNMWGDSVYKTSGWWTRDNGLGVSFMKDPYVSAAISKAKSSVIKQFREYLNGGELDTQMGSLKASLSMDSILWGRDSETYKDVRSWINARLDWVESH